MSEYKTLQIIKHALKLYIDRSDASEKDLVKKNVYWQKLKLKLKR